MAFVEDSDPFLADFAVSATKNGSATVSGVFDKAYGEAYGMIAGNDPVFRCPTASAVVRGNTLLIGGVTYTVTHVEGDGTGWDVCRLEAA